MPSKETICVVPETMPPTKDFFPSDVEDLVSDIKHRLQLKSRPSYHNVCSKQKRASPYSVPVRTLARSASDKENNNISTEHSSESCKFVKAKSISSSKRTTDDPYELLKELIREGCLIQEAVKRLQCGSRSTKSKRVDFYETDDYEVSTLSPRLVCDY